MRDQSGGAWLVTGAAGFIGFGVCRRLLEQRRTVVGVDNLNPYYDPNLKRARRNELLKDGLVFHQADLTDSDKLERIFARCSPETVIHLAAQVGVSRSLVDPMAYIQSNVVGTMNILELCRHHHVAHLVYASSSSVYGANTRMPFSVHHPVDHPVSLYAATKRSNELMAHSYSHLFGLPTSGLRFFTVYGPWGRPDMAFYSFALAMNRGEPITIFGDGEQVRDFTYVDDIVEGILRLAVKPPGPTPDWDPRTSDPATSSAPFRLFNIGHGQQVTLNRLITLLEEGLSTKCKRLYQPSRSVDMAATHAEVEDLNSYVGFSPQTDIETGIAAFTKWFSEYHGK